MSNQAEPMLVTPSAVVSDDLNPPDRPFWVYDDMCPRDKNGLIVPRYSVQEAAKFFFARKPDWLRWRGRPTPTHPEGFFVHETVRLEQKRTDAGARSHSLADVERMAHALARNDALDGVTLTKVIMLIKWQARLYGVIE
jgi:hypothetical protein